MKLEIRDIKYLKPIRYNPSDIDKYRIAICIQGDGADYIYLPNKEYYRGDYREEIPKLLRQYPKEKIYAYDPISGQAWILSKRIVLKALEEELHEIEEDIKKWSKRKSKTAKMLVEALERSKNKLLKIIEDLE